MRSFSLIRKRGEGLPPSGNWDTESGEKTMLKKALIGTGVLMVMGAFVFGRDVFSYARTWGASVRNAVKAEVPIEFEVQRAREMVEKIVPDIRECMHKIAEQQVDIEHRTREVAQRDEEM